MSVTYPPPVTVLKNKAETFLRTCRAKDYRKAKASGELQEWIGLKVQNCQDEAQSLMASGVWEQEAWNRAIRSQILESETD